MCYAFAGSGCSLNSQYVVHALSGDDSAPVAQYATGSLQCAAVTNAGGSSVQLTCTSSNAVSVAVRLCVTSVLQMVLLVPGAFNSVVCCR